MENERADRPDNEHPVRSALNIKTKFLCKNCQVLLLPAVVGHCRRQVDHTTESDV